MAGVERRPAPVSAIEVDVQVVPDDMHGLGGIEGRDPLHEPHEIVRRPRGPAVAHDTAPVHFEGAQQRLRAVSRVLELASAPTAWLRRAIRKPTLQRLHARLLVDREHHRAGRGLQVELGDLRHLLAKLRIGTVEPTLDPVWPQIVLDQQALVAAPPNAHRRGGGRSLRRPTRRSCASSCPRGAPPARRPGRSTPSASRAQTSAETRAAACPAARALRGVETDLASARRCEDGRPLAEPRRRHCRRPPRPR